MAANTRFLFLLSIIIFVNSWIQKTWAFVRSAGPKSSFNIIFKSIIVRKKLIIRLMLCFASPRETRPRKKRSKMRILKFFIVADLTNQGQSSRAQSIRPLNSWPFAASLNSHLQDSCLIAVVSILDPAPKQVSPWRALLADQYWRLEAAATWATDKRLWGLEGQKTRPKKRLWRNWKSATLLEPSIHFQNPLHRGDHSISQQSSSKAF